MHGRCRRGSWFGAGSKLAANVERAIGVPATARNWRTVTRLLSMAEDLATG